MSANQRMSDRHIKYTIDYLNGALKMDREAITALVEYRVPCNEELLSHRQLQAGDMPDGSPGVGMLGVINGIFGTIKDGPRAGWGFITAVFDDEGKLTHFMRTEENP